MDRSEATAYLERDWSSARSLKNRFWAERKRAVKPEEALWIAEGLRQHVRLLRPEWPDDGQRQADLRTHTRVSEGLRRARKPASG